MRDSTPQVVRHIIALFLWRWQKIVETRLRVNKIRENIR